MSDIILDRLLAEARLDTTQFDRAQAEALGSLRAFAGEVNRSVGSLPSGLEAASTGAATLSRQLDGTRASLEALNRVARDTPRFPTEAGAPPTGPAPARPAPSVPAPPTSAAPALEAETLARRDAAQASLAHAAATDRATVAAREDALATATLETRLRATRQAEADAAEATAAHAFAARRAADDVAAQAQAEARLAATPPSVAASVPPGQPGAQPGAVALREALAATGEATRQLAQIEAGYREAGTAVSQLISGPLDQLEQRLRGISEIPAGVNLDPLKAALADGTRGTQALTDAIRSGAVAELQRMGASATEVAAAVRGLASAPPIRLDTGPATANLDALTAKLGGVRREVADVNAVLAVRPPPVPVAPPLPPTQDFSQLSEGLIGFRTAAAEAQARADALRATMLQEGQAARRAAGENEAAAVALGSLGRASAATGAGFDLSHQGARRLQSGLTQLAVQATATSSAVGQVASGLLIAGGGVGALAGVAVAVGGVAAAYRFLTTAQREARAEQDQLVQGLLSEANSAMPAAERAARALAAALEAQARARRDLRNLEINTAVVAAAPLVGGNFANAALQEIARQRLHTEQEAQRAERQARADQARSVGENERENARISAQGIQFGTISNEQRQRAIGLVGQLTASLRQNIGTQAEQIQNAQSLLTLQQALASDDTIRTTARREQAAAMRDLVAEFTRAVGAGLQINDATRLTSAYLAQERAVAADTTRSIGDRLRAEANVSALVQARIAPLEREAEAAGRVADQALEAFQRQTRDRPAATTIALGVTVDTEPLREAERSIEVQIGTLGELRRRYRDSVPDVARLTGEIDQLRASQQQVNDAIEAAPIEGLTRQAGALGDRLSVLRERWAGVAGGTAEAQRVAAGLAGEYARLEGAIATQGGPLGANLELLRASARALSELGPGTRPLVAGLGLAAERAAELQARLAGLDDLAARIPAVRVGAEADLDSARAAVAALQAEIARRSDDRVLGPKLARIDLDQNLQETETRLAAVSRAFADVRAETNRWTGDLARSGEVGDRALASILARNDALAAALLDTRTPSQQLADSLNVVGLSARGLTDVGTSLGFIGEEAARSINAVAELGDALAAVIADASTGNIIGAVTAGIGAIGSLFGKSATEQEHDAILARNTEVLAQATEAYRASQSGRFVGIAGQAEAESRLHAFNLRRDPEAVADRAAAQGAFEPVGISAREGLEALAREAGFTADELLRLAKENGITLLDSKSRLVAGALEALDQAMRQAAQEAEGFSKTFSDQLDFLGLESRLRGEKQTPEVRFRTEVEALRQAGAGGIAKGFEGADTAAEIRAEALRQLELFKNKAIPPEQLGTLSSDDFKRFLNDAANAADAMDQLANSAQDASRQLQNVPDFLKLGELEFGARRTGVEGLPTGVLPPSGTPGTTVANEPPGPQKGTDFTPDFRADVSAGVGEALTPPLDRLSDVMAGLGTHAPSDLLAALSELETAGKQAPADELGRLDEMANRLAALASSTPDDLLAPIRRSADLLAVLANEAAAPGAQPAPGPAPSFAVSPRGGDGAAFPLPASVTNTTNIRNFYHTAPIVIQFTGPQPANAAEFARTVTAEQARVLLATSGDDDVDL